MAEIVPAPVSAVAVQNFPYYFSSSVANVSYAAFITASATSASSTGTIFKDLLYAVPLVVPRSITLNRIWIKCGGDVGVTARLGIYGTISSTNIYPGSLILDAGEIDLSVAGIKSIDISQSLSTGLYWLSYLGSANATNGIGLYPAGFYRPILGIDSTDISKPYYALNASQAYGPLPSSYPGTSTLLSATIPMILVRLA